MCWVSLAGCSVARNLPQQQHKVSLVALLALLFGLAWLMSSVNGMSTADYIRQTLGMK
jgi:hypothetical protein